VTHPFNKCRFRRIIASAVRATVNVQLQPIGSRLRAFRPAKDESYTLPLSPQGGTETLIRCFTSKTDRILSMKLCYQISLRLNFHIKRLYCPWCPHRLAQKCIFCMILRIMRDVNRKCIKLRAVSAIAELFVFWLCYCVCHDIFAFTDGVRGHMVLLSWINK